MIKLILAELYRIFHKKSMYIYFAALLIGYSLLAFIRSAGFTEESVIKDAMTFFSLFPAFAGSFFFSVIYTDDLNSQNLINLVGYGINKTVIVLVKFSLALLLNLLFFSLLPLFHYVIYALLGNVASNTQLVTLLVIAFKFLLLTLAYTLLSAIIVYGLQRSTFAIVSYILLAFGVIRTILTAIINMLQLNIGEHLLSGITDRILLVLLTEGSLLLPSLEYMIYIIVALLVAIIAFHQKEMEF